MINKMLRKWNKISSLSFFEKNQNTELEYAIHIKGTGKTDKNLVIAGGTHGDEPVGVRFAKYLFEQIKKGKIEFLGKNLYLILGNPEAFKKDVRFLEENLNRCYGEALSDSFTPQNYEQKRAKQIMEFLKDKNINLAIDLHSVSVGDTRLYVLHDKSLQLLDTIKSFSELDFYFIAREQHVPGTFTGAMENLDSYGIAIECGNHYNNKAIKVAKKEVLNLLVKLGYIKAKAPKTNPAKSIKVYRTVSLVKPDKDFRWALEHVASEVKIKKGQIFAKDAKKTHICLQDAYLIMPTAQERVKHTDNDAGFLCEKIQ